MMVCDLDNTVKVILIYIFRPTRIYMKLLSVNLVINLWIYLHDFYNSFKHCEWPHRKNVQGDYCRCTMECLLQMQNKIKKNKTKQNKQQTHTQKIKNKRKKFNLYKTKSGISVEIILIKNQAISTCSALVRNKKRCEWNKTWLERSKTRLKSSKWDVSREMVVT